MTTQKPEALRLAEILEGDYCPDWFYEQGVDEVGAELRRQHTRIAELEAQLEAIGAGGVSGPLMGQPQAPSGWREAIGEIRAGLEDSEPSGYDNSGYRAFAGTVLDAVEEALTELITHPPPPEGMVGGWQDIATAPKDGTRFVAVGQNYGLDSEKQHTCIAQWLAGCWVEVSDWNGASKLKYLTHWMPLPPLPGSAARAPADSLLEDAACAGFFLRLPQRPKPEAPAGTVGLDWDAYSGAQMLAYGRDCSNAAIVATQKQGGL